MKFKNHYLLTGVLGCLLILFASQVQAQSLENFEKKVSTFTLDNGLTFIVIKRPVAPVVSMESYVNVGSANEPAGYTGIAHVFEHMAFKGTPNIGTKNWQKEQPVLRKEDQAYQQWLEEKYSTQTDSSRLNDLWKKFKSLQDKEEQYVKNNQFSQLIQRNGGQGLNASTAQDRTEFHYSLPENRLQLWFALESARFEHPVFREFYKEKKVIKEERRMRTESNPVGRLLEAFTTSAFSTFPYSHPVVGWMSDITATTMADARNFYNKYYVPKNMTMAIAGDVDVDQIKQWARQYFGDMKATPPPPAIHTREPAQKGQKVITIHGQSQPIILMGYHTVANDNPDASALQLLSSVLSGGRTSILYKHLVQDKQQALQVQALNGYPGDKLQSMMIIFAAPNHDVPADTLQHSILQEIQKVKTGIITKEALQRAKTNARANLIRSLDSNRGLALQLAQAQAQHGDWRYVFRHIRDLQDVTLDDLQRVAQKYLTTDNLTVGKIVPKEVKHNEAASTDK